MDDDETLVHKPEVFLYKMPLEIQRKEKYIHRASDWDLASPSWHGKLTIFAAGPTCHLQLEDNKGTLFGQAVIDSYPGKVLDDVIDSTRYFALKMQKKNGEFEKVGMGFSNRKDSADLKSALKKYFQEHSVNVLKRPASQSAPVVTSPSPKKLKVAEVNPQPQKPCVQKVGVSAKPGVQPSTKPQIQNAPSNSQATKPPPTPPGLATKPAGKPAPALKSQAPPPPAISKPPVVYTQSKTQPGKAPVAAPSGATTATSKIASAPATAKATPASTKSATVVVMKAPPGPKAVQGQSPASVQSAGMKPTGTPAGPKTSAGKASPMTAKSMGTKPRATLQTVPSKSTTVIPKAVGMTPKLPTAPPPPKISGSPQPAATTLPKPILKSAGTIGKQTPVATVSQTLQKTAVAKAQTNPAAVTATVKSPAVVSVQKPAQPPLKSILKKSNAAPPVPIVPTAPVLVTPAPKVVPPAPTKPVAKKPLVPYDEKPSALGAYDDKKTEYQVPTVDISSEGSVSSDDAPKPPRATTAPRSAAKPITVQPEGTNKTTLTLSDSKESSDSTTTKSSPLTSSPVKDGLKSSKSDSQPAVNSRESNESHQKNHTARKTSSEEPVDQRMIDSPTMDSTDSTAISKVSESTVAAVQNFDKEISYQDESLGISKLAKKDDGIKPMDTTAENLPESNDKDEKIPSITNISEQQVENKDHKPTEQLKAGTKTEIEKSQMETEDHVKISQDQTSVAEDNKSEKVQSVESAEVNSDTHHEQSKDLKEIQHPSIDQNPPEQLPQGIGNAAMDQDDSIQIVDESVKHGELHRQDPDAHECAKVSETAHSGQVYNDQEFPQEQQVEECAQYPEGADNADDNKRNEIPEGPVGEDLVQGEDFAEAEDHEEAHGEAPEIANDEEEYENEDAGEGDEGFQDEQNEFVGDDEAYPTSTNEEYADQEEGTEDQDGKGEEEYAEDYEECEGTEAEFTENFEEVEGAAESTDNFDEAEGAGYDEENEYDAGEQDIDADETTEDGSAEAENEEMDVTEGLGVNPDDLPDFGLAPDDDADMADVQDLEPSVNVDPLAESDGGTDPNEQGNQEEFEAQEEESEDVQDPLSEPADADQDVEGNEEEESEAQEESEDLQGSFADSEVSESVDDSPVDDSLEGDTLEVPEEDDDTMEYPTPDVISSILPDYKYRNGSMFQCHKCPETFEDLRRIKSHWMSAHSYRRPAQCCVCKLPFPSQRECSLHRSKVHGFTCPDCGKLFKKENGMKDHIHKVHGKKVEFVCPLCEASFKLKFQLIKHVEIEHEDKTGEAILHTCKTCHEKFLNEKDLAGHELTHVENYACEQCSQRFRSRTTLRTHYRQVHPGCNLPTNQD